MGRESQEYEVLDIDRSWLVQKTKQLKVYVQYQDSPVYHPWVIDANSYSPDIPATSLTRYPHIAGCAVGHLRSFGVARRDPVGTPYGPRTIEFSKNYQL